MTAGEDLYRLDAGALADLDADLVVTQDLCAVCAVDVSVVDDALAYLGCRAEVLTLDPQDLDEVLASVETLGKATGTEEVATALVRSLRRRLDVVRAAVAGLEPVPVMVLEWTDPPFTPGHWVPDMVTAAGGVPVMGRSGRRSGRTTWQDVADAGPAVVVAAPCGFGLDESARLAHDVADRVACRRAVVGGRRQRVLRATRATARRRHRGARRDPAPGRRAAARGVAGAPPPLTRTFVAVRRG